MRVKRHFVVSLIVGLISLSFPQSVPVLRIELFGYEIAVFVLVILVGVFIDVDHILDYYLSRGIMFSSLESRFRSGKMIVLLHGVENVAVLAVLSAVLQLHFLIFPIISYSFHMVMDAYGNNVSVQAYSYIIRFGNKLALRVQRKL